MYDRLMQWSWEETRIYAAAYFNRLEFSVHKACGEVLEIGCGIGTMTRWLSSSENVKHVWAVDAYSEAIEALEKANLPKVTPLRMAVQDLNLGWKDRFDTVMICEVLEHLYPDEERRMIDALRPYVDARTHFVVSVPIGWLSDRYHVRSFSQRAFK